MHRPLFHSTRLMLECARCLQEWGHRVCQKALPKHEGPAVVVVRVHVAVMLAAVERKPSDMIMATRQATHLGISLARGQSPLVLVLLVLLLLLALLPVRVLECWCSSRQENQSCSRSLVVPGTMIRTLSALRAFRILS